MKLSEIFESTVGRGVDRGIEGDWRDQMAAQHAARRNVQSSTGTSVTGGFWLISREGKRLAGPFTSEENANKYKVGRPDKIPANAVVKEL